jgi:hypothetical protein
MPVRAAAAAAAMAAACSFFSRAAAPRARPLSLPARLLPALAGSWLLENEIVARADAELVVVHGF